MELYLLFNVPSPTVLYTLSLHDALPISVKLVANSRGQAAVFLDGKADTLAFVDESGRVTGTRSEEHTSELQSHSDLVCRLLLEKKNTIPNRSLNSRRL